MDNLGSHKVKGVREAIEAAGASLMFIPPYSPDLNPIEQGSPSSRPCYGQRNSEPSMHYGKQSETSPIASPPKSAPTSSAMPVISSQPENGLKRSGVTYGELAKRLESHGLHETEASITNKLARATVPATLLLATFAALGMDGMKLDDRSHRMDNGKEGGTNV